MIAQSKYGLVRGKRVNCGVCCGLARNLNVSCERCNSKGSVLVTLRYEPKPVDDTVEMHYAGLERLGDAS